jgi:D-3-phosphoglycerate dehydrogenase
MIHGAVGLVVSTSIPVDPSLIDEAANLKWIARMGSGMEHIDTSYAEQKGIQCFSSPEGNSQAVAEFTLGLMISLLRNISRSGKQLRDKIWERESNRGPELSSCCFGVIGFGHTGKATVNLLLSMGCRVLVYDKYIKGFGNELIIESSLQDLKQNAQVISLHIPLNPENKYIISHDFFEGLQQRPMLINVSRGEIVDTHALIRALEEGKISGAALDVLENENIKSWNEEQTAQFDFLSNSKQVILTPHLAGYSSESTRKMGETLLKKLGLS